MPNNGLTLTDGVDSLDLYVAAFSEHAPRQLGESRASFNNTLRSSVRSSLREFTVTIPQMQKTDYQTLRGMIADDAVVTVSGDVLLNDALPCIVSATFDLVGVGTPVDSVSFLFDVQLTIREVGTSVDSVTVAEA